MPAHRSSVCLLLALCLPGAAGAGGAGPVDLPETPQFRQIGVDQGLPSSRVNALAQDRQGYLWVATDDGVARYDGTGFRVWQYNPGIVGGMPGNSVQTLFIDREDRVWLGIADGGLAYIDRDRRTVQALDPQALPGLGDALPWSLAQTGDGRLWVSTFGAGLYHGRDGRFEAMGSVPAGASATPQSMVLGMAVDGEGVLWIGTVAGLARVVEDRIEAVAAGALDGESIVSIALTRDGSLWFKTRSGPLWLRRPGGVIEPSPWNAALAGVRVHGVVQDHYGHHWLHTVHGLYFDDGSGLRRVQEPEAEEGDYLSGLLDHQGGLWFGDAERGLIWLSAAWRGFASYSRRGPPALRLSMRQALAFAVEPDGQLLLGGEDGRVDRMSADGRRIEQGVLPPAAIGNGRVFALRSTPQGGLWLGGPSLLAHRDPQGRWRQWREQGQDALLRGAVDQLVLLPDGGLWLSSYGGGLQWRDAQGRVLRTIAAGDGQGLDSPDTEVLLLGKDGGLWVGNSQGILRWDGQRFVLLSGVGPGPVQGLAFVDEDEFWAYRPGLLERYRFDGRALQRIDAANWGDDGIPPAEAGGIALDALGRVWLPTVRGLVRFDPAQRRLRLFGPGDGLPDREFGLRAPLLLADGRILVGSVGGAVLFDPQQVAQDPPLPPLVIDSIQVRRAEDLVPLDPTRPLLLQPEDRDLQVVARLMSFADPAGHRYRFRLEGYDPDWVEVGAAGERFLPRLPAGEYRMDIAAATADGRWTAPIRLQLRVLPPWWQTVWAAAAMVALLLLTLAGSALAYRRRLKARGERLLALEQQAMAQRASEAKSRFLADLGHELRTPLTGVLGMTELLLRNELAADQRQRAEIVQRAGQHLLRLVNDTLDLARIEAGRLVLQDEPYDPAALLRELALLLRPLAEDKGLQFELSIAPGLPARLRGDPGRIRQILLNLGGNAIQYTHAGRVGLQLAPGDGQLEFVVEDTGVGLTEDEQQRLFQRFERGGDAPGRSPGGSGLGLAISRELARAMGGELRVQSRKGEGSRFRLCLPDTAAAVPADFAPPPGLAAVDGDYRPPAARVVLLVEDDPLVAQVLQGLLEGLGHRVHHARQALAALTLLETERIEFALLDLDLPAIDGFELARMIRRSGRTLPLLAVSARCDAASEQAARAAGMDGYLRKPVDGAALQEAMARCASSAARVSM